MDCICLMYLKSFQLLISCEELWLLCVAQNPLPCSPFYVYQILLSKQRTHWNHSRSVVDMSTGKTSKSRHSTVNSTGSQMGTHSDVMSVSRHSSNHIGWIYIFESGFEFFFFTKLNNLCFEEFSNILHK